MVHLNLYVREFFHRLRDERLLLKIVKAQAFWTAFLIISNHWLPGRFCGFVFLLQFALGFALRFFRLFFLARALFLTFAKGASRSCHGPS
jgi:hypothetical protein